MAKRTRSAAARKGWATRRKNERQRDRERAARSKRARDAYNRRVVREKSLPALAGFVGALRTGASHDVVKRTHREWLRVRRLGRDFLGSRQFRVVLEQIGDALGLDDSFVDALDESPDSDEA